MLTLTDVASEIVEQMRCRQVGAEELGAVARLIATELDAAGYDLRHEPALDEVKQLLVAVCRSARRPVDGADGFDGWFAESPWDEWD